MQNTKLTKKKQNIVKHKNLLSDLKMEKEILTFGDIETGKNNFTAIKVPFFKNRCRYWENISI